MGDTSQEKAALQWATREVNRRFTARTLSAQERDQYIGMVTSSLNADTSKLANIHAEQVYRAAFVECLGALNSNLEATFAQGGSAATIPPGLAAKVALNCDRLGKVAYTVAEGLRVFHSGGHEGRLSFVQEWLPKQHAAVEAVHGLPVGYGQAPQYFSQIVAVARALENSLAVLCASMSQVTNGGAQATRRFMGLYISLCNPFSQASSEARQECIEEQSSLSKPEIGRRVARLYFGGGTKEGWEKAARRRFP
ncbi:hypothetical protein JCM11641_002070 [Rhodosporidiobolus odoratus]